MSSPVNIDDADEVWDALQAQFSRIDAVARRGRGRPREDGLERVLLPTSDAAILRSLGGGDEAGAVRVLLASTKGILWTLVDGAPVRLGAKS